MRHTLSFTLILPLLLAASFAADAPPASQPAAVERDKPLAVGDKAPDFALQTLDHKTITLSKLLESGPVVVIDLRGWVTYQCPICIRQTGEIISHSREILATGAHVIFIYPGPADKLQQHAQEFIAGKGLPDGYSFVIDPDMKSTASWGLRWNKAKENVYPSTFIINKDGTVRFAKISHSHGDRATSADILKSLSEKP